MTGSLSDSHFYNAEITIINMKSERERVKLFHLHPEEPKPVGNGFSIG